jgi:hypothetical protein
MEENDADYDFANRSRYNDRRIGDSRANWYSPKQWSWCSRVAGEQVRSSRETGRAQSHSIRTGPEQSPWIAWKQIRACTTKTAEAVIHFKGRHSGGLLFARRREQISATREQHRVATKRARGRLLLEIDVRGAFARFLYDKTGVQFLDRPGRRETAFGQVATTPMGSQGDSGTAQS